MRHRPFKPVWGALVTLMLPGLACAHGSAQGLGAFWNGMLHPALEPAQMLALLALGLWLAQHTLPRAVERRALLAAGGCFVLALAGGRLSGRDIALADGGLPEWLLQVAGLVMAAATVAGLAISAQRRSGWAWLVPPACGLTLGAVALASPAGELRGLAALGWYSGVAVGVALMLGYTVIGARWVARRFSVGPLVPRVLASWLAASLLLVAVLPLVRR